LRADLAARGLECEDFTEVSVPSAAAAGHCDVGGQDLVLALWQSPVERDSRTSDLIIAADDDACFVLGRGNGAWSVDGDGNPGLCAKVADALGGEVWPQ
jgi:hypothetical protein